MKLDRIFGWLVGISICLLLLAEGCAPLAKEPAVPLEAEPGEPALEAGVEEAAEPLEQTPEVEAAETVTLALKFTVGDTATYRVITEAQRGVKFQGSLSRDQAFEGGRNYSRLEMTFTQQIQSIDNEGNAAARITIEELEYVAEFKDKNRPPIDFASSREEDEESPLAALIGQSYLIKITPAAEVIEVMDVAEARAAVKGFAPAKKVALRLLSPDLIKQRHGNMTLPAVGQNQLCEGDSWSSTRTFSFDLMGAKSYEKIHAIRQIEDTESRRTAVIEMNAIPTSEIAEQLHGKQSAGALLDMFDNTETYTGRLTWDSTAGKIETYLEQMRSEWIIVDPDAEQKADTEPDAVIMNAGYLYSLERID